MNQEKLRERVHDGIDRHCAPLIADPYRVQKVLYAAQQKGEQTVKKKLHVTLILAMVLVLMAATAFAVVTIYETGRLFARTEREAGDYIDWPTEKKTTVVCQLIDEGYVRETSARKLLREGALTPEEAARVADEAIAELTGDEARAASFLSVMSAVWGDFEQWSQEQKSWYSQVMADVGAQTDDKTYYVDAEVVISQQEAIDAAKKEIARGFAMDATLLDQYRVYEASLQIPEFAGDGDTKAYWYIAMDTAQTELESRADVPFHAIDVFIDPDTGALLEPIEERVAAVKAAQDAHRHPLTEAIQAFEADVNEPKAFQTWTLEHKARWSQEIAPQISAYIETNGEAASPVQGYETKMTIAYVYGMPDEHAIQQQKAMQLARDALVATYGLSEEEISLLMDNGLSLDEPAWFYDVTDSAHPMWKIIFTMPSVYCSDDAVAARVKAIYGKGTDHHQFYLVEINAYTGEAIRTFAAMSWPEMLEAF